VDLTQYYTFATSGQYTDLVNSPYSFARTTDLAKLYGLSTVWDGTASTLTPFPTAQPRTGLLTRAAFLISGTEYSDPIIKGKNVRFNVLCQVLPPPPPTVNVVPVREDSTHTTRWLVEQATAGTSSNPAQCLQCHGSMNPLGFVSEDYDSLGRYRTHELKFDDTTGVQNGSVPVNTPDVGALFPGDTQLLQDAVALDAYIAQLGMGQRCMAVQYFRYAFGRQEVPAQDGCTLESMRQTVANDTLLQMFAATTAQRQFLYRQVQ
ncbi:MAG TPA: DUF1588 domain-containing protein, partial [Gemmatimonadales bacterium]|nr:DUF1588 domain-containing protein [Gemmatimonadales bacterium]